MLVAVERRGEERHVDRVLPVGGDVREVGREDFPVLLVEAVGLVPGDEAVVVEPVRDVEVAARTDDDIVKRHGQRGGDGTAYRLALAPALARLRLDGDEVFAWLGVLGRDDREPEGVRLVLGENGGVLVEEGVRHEAGELAEAVRVERIVKDWVVVVEEGHVADAADTNSPPFRAFGGDGGLHIVVGAHGKLEAEALVESRVD